MMPEDKLMVERVARIIDPELHDDIERYSIVSRQGFIAREQWKSTLAKADAILSATGVEGLLEALTKLATLVEAIRDDSTSTHFRFGATEAERKNRVQQLLTFIEANGDKLDGALNEAFAAIAKAGGQEA